MKVSYSWLKDYVDVNIDPKKLEELLTMAGVTVSSCEKIGKEYIFEFEITANRADCLSVIGIARETAAILGKKLKVPKELKTPKPKTAYRKPITENLKSKINFNVSIKDPDLCPRYTARVIRDVEVAPSPDWLKERIISVGLRPVNNIVDITNFVLFETGQPMHAFDLDRLKGGVIVRRAKKGENIITIDNTQRLPGEDTLVIADEKEPIAIAGVIGGSATEVNDMTKNILLESANFNPISIRRTSRALGLSSESSYRFERRIDNDMVLKASERASALIKEIAGGKVETLFDVGKKSAYSKRITLDPGRVSSILGISLEKARASKILRSLGFSVKEENARLNVTVPSFREDVKNETDLTEEIARIYGYENVPLTIPRIIGNTKTKDLEDTIEEKIKDILIRLDLNEIITYSLIKRNKINDLGIKDENIVSIKNPLSIDQEIMRPSLLSGMLSSISYNLNRKAKRLSFFEIGKTYEERNGSYAENRILSMGLTGIKSENWKTHKDEFGFFDMKGVFEKLLEELKIEGAVFKKAEAPGLDKNATSIVEYDGEIIGHLGVVSERVSKNADVDKEVFYAELYIERILKKVSLDKRYAAYSRYPAVTRDISIVLDKGLTSGEVVTLIKEAGGKLVKEVSLEDYYKGKHIPLDKNGLLYRIEYRSDERTLEDAEVEKIHSEIKKALSEKLNVSFR
ncbi:MAG: phenylalanine--tRNA ligase subunit beta [Candidatus Omnitrophica bacterium]|nr:phenylalanine--tRNA ligase subunit beta [Candidatus Omnitrophota bacterium]